MGMKKFLQDHQAEEEKMQKSANALNSERSASFHFVPTDENNSKIIQRGGRGSVSSSGFVLDTVTKKNNEMGRCNYKYNVDYTLGTCQEGSANPKITTSTSFRHRFITGLKSAFRISNSATNLRKLE